MRNNMKPIEIIITILEAQESIQQISEKLNKDDDQILLDYLSAWRLPSHYLLSKIIQHIDFSNDELYAKQIKWINILNQENYEDDKFRFHYTKGILNNYQKLYKLLKQQQQVEPILPTSKEFDHTGCVFITKYGWVHESRLRIIKTESETFYTLLTPSDRDLTTNANMSLSNSNTISLQDVFMPLPFAESAETLATLRQEIRQEQLENTLSPRSFTITHAAKYLNIPTIMLSNMRYRALDQSKPYIPLKGRFKGVQLSIIIPDLEKSRYSQNILDQWLATHKNKKPAKRTNPY